MHLLSDGDISLMDLGAYVLFWNAASPNGDVTPYSIQSEMEQSTMATVDQFV
jgi:hypothetical protein